MYFYILDPNNLTTEKFEKRQIELQGLLAEFNIAGETARVGPLRGISELIETAKSRGAKTLVACGTDDTFNLMLAHLKNKDFTLGFVPFQDDSYLAGILGLRDLRTAVKTLAGRRIEHIDLAVANSYYFISYLEMGVTPYELKRAGMLASMKLMLSRPEKVLVRIDDSYIMEFPLFSAMVVNSRSTSSKFAKMANPSDGFLDLLIADRPSSLSLWQSRELLSNGLIERLENPSVIRCRKIEFLEPKGYPIYLSGKILTKFPVTVELVSNKLKLIVGRNRTF